jgi:dihydroorotate dehydrogenase
MPSHFGAIVTGPVSVRAQRGHPPPRLAEIPAGFALLPGDHNPGYHRVLRDHDAFWRRLGVPVIVALAASHPEDWVRLGQHLEEESAAAGLELSLPADAGRGEAAAWVSGVRRACTLPLLVKLPSLTADALTVACADAGADALVIGSAPAARARAAGPAGQGPEAAWLDAPIGGPAAFPFTLRALRAVAALSCGLPLVAAGGITRPDDARHCLGEGASAIQIRSLCWTDPAATIALAAMLGPAPPIIGGTL